MSITIKELARLCGVSHSTVSRVLNNKDRGQVSRNRRQQILAVAQKHGYRSNPAARGLVQGKTYRVAMCIEGSLATHGLSDKLNVYDRLEWFSSALQLTGYATEIINVNEGRPPEEINRELTARAVDGFVFLGWSPECVERQRFALKLKGVPALASGTTLKDQGFTWTDIDTASIFKQAVRHLVREGHTRIALIKSSPDSMPIKMNSFLEAMRNELGIDARDLVFEYTHPSFEGAMGAAEQALDSPGAPTALILTSNFDYAVVLHAMRHRGIEPGRDCRVIGCGHTILAERGSPKLSHYPPQIKDQVDFGLKALMKEIENPDTYEPRHKVFRSKLMLRDT